jgi:hypothetical protein
MRANRSGGRQHGTGARLLCTAGLLAVAATAADAQQRPPVRFGLTGGASSPLGDFADVAQLGFHLGARLDVLVPGAPVTARAEAQWHRFTRKRAVAVGGAEKPPEVIPLTLNLDFGRGRERRGPGSYVTVGAGGYHRRTSAYFTPPGGGNLSVERRSSTRFGFNGGLGSTFQLGRYEGYLELRAHRVSGSGETGEEAIAFVPISLGIRF